jgi:hypothetical protein
MPMKYSEVRKAVQKFAVSRSELRDELRKLGRKLETVEGTLARLPEKLKRALRS